MKRQFIATGLFAAATLPLLATVMPSSAQVSSISSQQVREITVVVERATTEHNFDPNLSPFSDDEKPDFYARVGIAGVTRNSQVITNRKDAPLNFRMTQQVNVPVENAQPITIKLFDSDGSSGDDQADINPGSNRDWVVFYQPGTGTIFAPDGRTILGRSGNLITLRGNESGKNATIFFRITHLLR